ncbi:MAG: DUF4384 domain-containing protein [Pirellulales bacterium]
MSIAKQSLAVSLVLWMASAALADPPGAASPPTGEPEEIRQTEPSFLVRVDVDRSNREYREGDGIVCRVNCEVDAYLYVLYKQADGKVYQIFPNKVQPDNFVKARQAVQVPADDVRFRWQIGAPFGKEVLKVIASKQPLENISEEQTRTKQFIPLSKQEIKGIEVEIGEEKPTEWAEDQVEILTYAHDRAEAARGAKRVGVFFGVSEYEFNEEAKAASEEKQGMNLPCCHRDARRMVELMREAGRLDDARIYTNAEANRAQFEQAITKWLPSVTRPGDTVMIYFSGHGGQIPDDNGDEQDRQDEILLTHDFLSGAAVAGMLKLEKQYQDEGQPVPERLAGYLEVIREVARRSPSPEKAIEVLNRGTGVSDDLFGHWLQALSGRQIIVILDVCHAGGFATQEKSLLPSAKPFDFVDKELERLKDLGQPETAILAACATQDVSQVRLDAQYSVMTAGLMECIAGTSGILTLRDGAASCAERMRQYFEQVNKERTADGGEPVKGHEPVYYDYCTKPALLKP